MKILINRKPVEGPWGGGNLFVKAFCESASLRGHEVTFQLEDDIDARPEWAEGYLNECYCNGL